MANASRIEIESSERGFELHFILDEEPRVEEWGHMWINIQACDLDAFYDQVKGRIGPYLRERDEAFRTAFEQVPAAELQAEAYDRSDPKHPDFHSVHTDLWDNRAGK